jgi:hypothetical protein
MTVIVRSLSVILSFCTNARLRNLIIHRLTKVRTESTTRRPGEVRCRGSLPAAWARRAAARGLEAKGRAGGFAVEVGGVKEGVVEVSLGVNASYDVFVPSLIGHGSPIRRCLWDLLIVRLAKSFCAGCLCSMRRMKVIRTCVILRHCRKDNISATVVRRIDNGIATTGSSNMHNVLVVDDITLLCSSGK